MLGEFRKNLVEEIISYATQMCVADALVSPEFLSLREEVNQLSPQVAFRLFQIIQSQIIKADPNLKTKVIEIFEIDYLEQNETLIKQITQIINTKNPSESAFSEIQHKLGFSSPYAIGEYLETLLSKTPSHRWERLASVFNIYDKSIYPPADVLEFLLEKFEDNDEICILLLKQYMKLFPEENIMFEMAWRSKNVSKIQKMSKLHPNLFSQAVESHKNNLSNQEKKHFANKIEMLLNCQNAEYVTKSIAGFTHGFIDNTLEDGLLTALEIHNRKSSLTRATEDQYLFEPTVLAAGEFYNFLQLLKAVTPPIREKFVVTGGHWIAGEILINKEGEAQILIIDSLGAENETLLNKDTFQRINEAAIVFPSAPIYLDSNKRQRSMKGCSIFALDDVRHLYTIERYLPEQYRKGGLFDYLKDKALQRKTSLSAGINYTTLPLPFLRTMHGKGLMPLMKSRTEELDLPLGKGKSTGRAYTESRNIQFKEGIVEENSKLVNKRLDMKMNKMAEYNLQLLLTTSEEEIEAQKGKFTLSALAQRLEQTQAESKKRSASTLQHSPLYQKILESAQSLSFMEVPKPIKDEFNRMPPTEVIYLFNHIQDNEAQLLLDDTVKNNVLDIFSLTEEEQNRLSQSLSKRMADEAGLSKLEITNFQAKLARLDPKALLACLEKLCSKRPSPKRAKELTEIFNVLDTSIYGNSEVREFLLSEMPRNNYADEILNTLLTQVPTVRRSPPILPIASRSDSPASTDSDSDSSLEPPSFNKTS